jgi:hypothetical protein
MQLDSKKREQTKTFQTIHIHHKENSLPPQIQGQPRRVKEDKEKKKQYSLSDFQILTTLGISLHRNWNFWESEARTLQR